MKILVMELDHLPQAPLHYILNPVLDLRLFPERADDRPQLLERDRQQTEVIGMDNSPSIKQFRLGGLEVVHLLADRDGLA